MAKKPVKIEIPDTRVEVKMHPETVDALRVLARAATAERRTHLPPRSRVTIAQIVRELCEEHTRTA